MRQLTYIFAAIALVGIVIWGIKGPWDSTTENLHKAGDNGAMRQIEPPKVILQAGTAPLGSSGKDSGEIKFKFETDEEGERVEDPKLVDENGNSLGDDPEVQKIWDDYEKKK